MSRPASTYRSNRIAQRTACNVTSQPARDARGRATGFSGLVFHKDEVYSGASGREVVRTPWNGNYRDGYVRGQSVHEHRASRGVSYRATEAEKVRTILHPAKPKAARKPRAKKGVA